MKSLLIVYSLIALQSSLALAHSDVRPRVDSGKIVTDAWEDATSTLEPGVRMFGFDFAEDVADPFNIQDPGFNAAAGSGLSAGADLKFDILGSLQYWNGLGSVSLANVSTGEKLHLYLGTGNATVTGSSGTQTGFKIQTVAGNESVHRHLNAELLGSDGNFIPAGPGAWGAGDGVEAAAGVYVLPIDLYLTSGSIARSEPLYLVFNNGLTEEQHDTAIDFVQANLLPEPASLASIGFASAALLMRRRR